MTTSLGPLIAVKGFFYHSLTNYDSLSSSFSKGKPIRLLPYTKATSTRKGEMTPMGISQ